MENELDDLTEVAACIEAARLALLPIIARMEQREQARIRQARKRANAPIRQGASPAQRSA